MPDTVEVPPDRRYHAGSLEKLEAWQKASMDELLWEIQRRLEPLGCTRFSLKMEGVSVGDFAILDLHGEPHKDPNRGWMSNCTIASHPGHVDRTVKPYTLDRYSGWCPDNCNCCHYQPEEKT